MGGKGSGRHNQSDRIGVHDTIELEKNLFKRSFRDYVPDAFEVVESGEAYADAVRAGTQPARFMRGWHIDAVAEHLQAVADGQIRYLLINIPPGTAKSVETCVLWPTWMWGRSTTSAAHRHIFSSYSEEFTKRDTRKSKQLIQSAWYQSRFPHVVLKETPDTMTEHHNTLGGERHGASTNSGVTGKHVHGIVEDDPIKAQDAQSQRARDEAWFYRTQVLSSRLLPEAGWRVVIMQRLHEDDPSGRILAAAEKIDGQYVHLCLPMEFEAKRKCVTYMKRSEMLMSTIATDEYTKVFEDPRTQEGELLWPARMGGAFVAEKRSPQTGLGENGYAGQYQQRPAPAEGSIIKRDWIRYYRELPPVIDAWEQSWDLIFTDDGPGSYAVGQVWARSGANHYLVHQYRERVDFVRSLAALINVSQAYPLARRKKIENKANGAAMISVTKNKIAGVVAWPPKGKRMVSKSARLEACQPLFEAGNVHVLDPAIAPWVSSWVEEVVGMTPIGATTANDDQVDATSQYLDDKGFTAAGATFTLDLAVGAQDNPWRVAG